jgi:hypothetical protein
MTMEDEALDATATPAAVTHRAVGTWIALAAAAFIIVAVALAFAGFYLIKQREAKLEIRVAALEQKVAAMGAMPASPATPQSPPAGPSASEQAEVAALTQKVQDLQLANGLASGNHDTMMQTVGNLQSTVVALQGGMQTLSQTVEANKTKLGEIDQALSERRTENARQFSILLSVDQLRAAARTSDPFETELNASRLIARNDPELMKELDALAPYASDGAPTMNELRGEFSDIASEIVRGNVVDNRGKWFRQALYRLSSVISIRRIGSNVPGNSAEAIVARAEAKLEEDDLGGAVAALKGLDDLPHDYPKSVAAGWVDAAERRLAVDAALSDLGEIAIDRVNGLAAVSPAGAVK